MRALPFARRPASSLWRGARRTGARRAPDNGATVPETSQSSRGPEYPARTLLHSSRQPAPLCSPCATCPDAPEPEQTSEPVRLTPLPPGEPGHGQQPATSPGLLIGRCTVPARPAARTRLHPTGGVRPSRASRPSEKASRPPCTASQDAAGSGHSADAITSRSMRACHVQSRRSGSCPWESSGTSWDFRPYQPERACTRSTTHDSRTAQVTALAGLSPGHLSNGCRRTPSGPRFSGQVGVRRHLRDVSGTCPGHFSDRLNAASSAAPSRTAVAASRGSRCRGRRCRRAADATGRGRGASGSSAP